MDFATLGELGSFMSGVAVVASLVYLAVQVRQNTRSVRAASFQALSESISDRSLRLAENPDLHGIYVRGLRGDELSESDAERFGSIMLSMVRLASNAFVQYRAGFLTEEQWLGFRIMPMTILSSRGGRIFWRRARAVFGAEFAAYIDAEILKRDERDAAQQGAAAPAS
jgi:hypothetical protein